MKKEIPFEFGEGDDVLTLLFLTVEQLKTFHHVVEVTLENDDTELPGRYITLTGTFKKLDKERMVVDA